MADRADAADRVDLVYREGLDLFSSVVDRLPEGGWTAATPCEGWRALDVLGHVGLTTAYGIALLSGEHPVWEQAEVPGDAVEGDPRAWWADLADRAGQLVAEVDLTVEVETAAGRRAVGDGLRFPAVDLYLHGWDLGRSIGLDVQIPARAIAFAHAVLDPVPDIQLRAPGRFAPVVPAPAGASATEAFVAWSGRDPHWTAR